MTELDFTYQIVEFHDQCDHQYFERESPRQPFFVCLNLRQGELIRLMVPTRDITHHVHVLQLQGNTGTG